MKNSSTDLKANAQRFFNAYAGHDVDGMIACCSADARGRYVPYGAEKIVPIRGGIEQIWRGLGQAVPGLEVKVLEMIAGEGDTVVVQALVGGPIKPAMDPLGISKGRVPHIPHCFILRFDSAGKISYLDAYWDNAVINGIMASDL
jgi:ketosteroid isomerase-like protein